MQEQRTQAETRLQEARAALDGRLNSPAGEVRLRSFGADAPIAAASLLEAAPALPSGLRCEGADAFPDVQYAWSCDGELHTVAPYATDRGGQSDRALRQAFAAHNRMDTGAYRCNHVGTVGWRPYVAIKGTAPTVATT